MSTLELVWTGLSVFGMAVATLLLREVYMDWRARRLLKTNGPLKLLIWSHARAGVAYLALHTVFALAGLSAMLEPDDGSPLTDARATRIGLFMCGQVVMVTFGLSDLRDRHHLRKET